MKQELIPKLTQCLSSAFNHHLTSNIIMAPQVSSTPSVPMVFPNGHSYRLSPTASNSFVFFEDSRPSEDTPLIAICLPGIGDTRRQFRMLAPLLHTQLGARVLLGDLRGFGDSTDFADEAGKSYSAYSPESVASDVTQLLEELHAKHPASEFLLLGNSLSAGSMVLAAVHAMTASSSSALKSKIKAIVLLGPILRNSSVDWWFRPLSYVLFPKLYGTPIWMSYYKTLYPVKQPADFERELEVLHSHMRAKRGNVVNVGRFCRASKSAVEAAMLTLGGGNASASPAVLAFYGRKDPDYMDFDAELAWIKGAIPRVAFFEDPEGGHYPHLEDPQRIVDAIAKAL